MRPDDSLHQPESADLQVRVRQEAVVAHLGQRALAASDCQAVMQETVELIAQTLDLPVCELYLSEPAERGGRQLKRVAQTGLDEAEASAPVEITLPISDETLVGLAWADEAAATSSDFESDRRLDGLAHHGQAGLVSGIAAVVYGGSGPRGVVCACDRQRREFNEDDVYFIQSMCNVLAAALQRLEAESAMRESERRLSTVIQAVPDFVALKDGRGGWMVVNDYGLRLFDLEGVAYRGQTDRELARYSPFFTEAFNYCAESDQRAWQEGQMSRSVEVIPQPDGEDLTFDVIKVPLFNADGSRRALVVVARDITARQRAERERQQTERRLKTLIENLPGVVYRCANDRKWTMEFVSEQVEALTGYPPEAFIDNAEVSFADLYMPEDAERVWREVQAALQERERFELQYRIQRRDGQVRTVREQGCGVWDEAGALVALEGFVTDVTEHVAASEARRAVEQRVRSYQNALVDLATLPELNEGQLDAALARIVRASAQTLEAASASVWMLDASGDMLHCRACYCRDEPDCRSNQAIHFTAAPRYAAALGRSRALVIPDVRADSRLTGLEGMTSCPRASEQPRAWLDAPIRVEGEVVGLLRVEEIGRTREWTAEQQQFAASAADLVTVGLDAAERRKTREAVQAHASQLQMMVEQSPAVIWTTDTDLRFTSVEGEVMRRLGADTQLMVGQTLEEFFGDPGFKAIEMHERALAGQVVRYEVEWRDTIFQAFLRPLRNDEGAVIGVVGTALDMSDSIRAEREREESERRFRHLFNSSPDAIVVEGLDGTILDVNDAACRLHNASREELLGRNHNELVPTDLRSEMERETPAAPGKVGGLEGFYYRPDGSTMPVEIRTRRIEFKDQPALLLHIRDITKRRAAELRSIGRDPLTHLPNRLMLKERLRLAIERAKRQTDYRFAVLFVDLDEFKQVNDGYGHNVGDRMLKRSARRMMAILRATDMVARVGGDEFVVLLEDIGSMEEAAMIAERLRLQIAEPVSIGKHVLHITASVGLTVTDYEQRRPDRLIDDADRAMYQAKRAGRDQTVVFTRSMRNGGEWADDADEDID